MNPRTNTPEQKELLAAILDTLPQTTATVDGVLIGSHLVATTCGGRTGLASCSGPHGLGGRKGVENVPGLPATGQELAHWLTEAPEGTPQARSLGLAAVNALLPLPEGLENIKGQDLIREHGAGRRVAVVGHFPFVERMGPQFEDLAVLELSPRKGDLPADKAADIIPHADMVAVTGTTLLNGTLAGLLQLCRKDAFVMVLGPSTPFAPVLFELGVNAIAGAIVNDLQSVRDGINRGLPFKAIEGAQALTWRRG